MTQKLEDSGERRTFSTGAVRDRGDLKSRPDLISPHAQIREGMIMTLGAQKYALRNWEQGIPISDCLASAQRHIEQFKRGDTNEDHIAQARWNLGVIIHYEEEIKAGRMDPSIDDMPKYAYAPPCPTCGGPVKSAYCPETGPEYLCVECGWTSLDAPPRDGREDLACPQCGGIYVSDDPCLGCGYRVGDHVMMGGVPSSIPTATEMELRTREVLPLVKEADPFPTGSILYESPPAAQKLEKWVASKESSLGFSLDHTKSDCPPTFYVAGPMRGYKNLNFPAFDAARDRGKQLGYDIISPADMDREHGIDPGRSLTVEDLETGDLSSGELHRIIRRDVEAIMALQPERGDGIAVLPGWMSSTGAVAEVALARWLGLPVVHVEDFQTRVE